MTLLQQDPPLSPTPPRVAQTQPSAVVPLTRTDHLVLLTGLSGAFVITLSAFATAANMPSIHHGIGLADGSDSWLQTVYMMSGLFGVVFSIALIRGVGLSRYMMANATIFCLAALGAALTPTEGFLFAFRAMQGLAAGAFGPIAFVSVFTVMAGPRLPFGLTLLAFTFMMPIGLAAAVADAIASNFGWRILFAIEALAGGVLALAAMWLIPRGVIVRSALKIDGVATFGLALSLALTVLVLTQAGQGPWFGEAVIIIGLAVAFVAMTIFLTRTLLSAAPLFRPALLLTRWFGVPILLNLVFRAGFIVPLFIAPQILTVSSGDQAAGIDRNMLWLTLGHLGALPLAWALLPRFDTRVVAGAGLLLCGFGGILAEHGQVAAMFAVVGAGQLLFLSANLLISAFPLKSLDLPTASVAFNATSILGAALGSAIAAYIGSGQPVASAVQNLTATLPSFQPLAFSNASLTFTLLLSIGAVGVYLIGSCPPPHIGFPWRWSSSAMHLDDPEI